MPESVHSDRMPTFTSIFVTLSQVLKSSSTTRAFRPSSSGIFSTRRCTGWIRSGRRTVNSVPLPCSVWTSTVPPIMSTMFLVMAMPRPVPWVLLTVEVRSRSKGEKIFCTNSWLMPIPLSLIRNSYSALPLAGPGNCFSRTETVPPAGVNLTALDNRFSST